MSLDDLLPWEGGAETDAERSPLVEVDALVAAGAFDTAQQAHVVRADKRTAEIGRAGRHSDGPAAAIWLDRRRIRPRREKVVAEPRLRERVAVGVTAGERKTHGVRLGHPLEGAGHVQPAEVEQRHVLPVARTPMHDRDDLPLRWPAADRLTSWDHELAERVVEDELEAVAIERQRAKDASMRALGQPPCALFAEVLHRAILHGGHGRFRQPGGHLGRRDRPMPA